MALNFFYPFTVFLVLLVINPFIANSRSLKSEVTSTTKPETFQFPPGLDGAHKGQTVKGLHEVKSYLNTFGYFPSGYEHLNDDKFDDSLDSALKTYQKRHHLTASGNLDSDTIKAMTTPRCGNPDIIHNPTKHTHKRSKFHMLSHYSFFPGNPTPRWSKFHLTYSFSGIRVIDLQELRPIITQAFAKWSAVSQFTFQEAAVGANPDIVIGFYRGNHGDGFPFEGRGRVLAHAFRPEIGHFHYDADENWSSNPSQDQVDLESVAIHEMGHLLGLGHSEDPNAIMYDTFSYGVIKKELNQDDINGIQALYA